MSLATELVTLLLHYIVPPPEEIRRLHVALSPDMFDAAYAYYALSGYERNLISFADFIEVAP